MAYIRSGLQILRQIIKDRFLCFCTNSVPAGHWPSGVPTHLMKQETVALLVTGQPVNDRASIFQIAEALFNDAAANNV